MERKAAVFQNGVDARQVVKALQLGAKMADSLGFQYIVTMNKDALPAALPKDFDLHQYIMPSRLTDATEDGGLFGIRVGARVFMKEGSWQPGNLIE